MDEMGRIYNNVVASIENDRKRDRRKTRSKQNQCDVHDDS
jgi:hypothetical protein